MRKRRHQLSIQKKQYITSDVEVIKRIMNIIANLKCKSHDLDEGFFLQNNLPTKYEISPLNINIIKKIKFAIEKYFFKLISVTHRFTETSTKCLRN